MTEREQALEEAAKRIEAMRDSHCADTQKSKDRDFWCQPTDTRCDFVSAWNMASTAIRSLTTQHSKD